MFVQPPRIRSLGHRNLLSTPDLVRVLTVFTEDGSKPVSTQNGIRVNYLQKACFKDSKV